MSPKKKTKDDAGQDAYLDAVAVGLGPEAAAAKVGLTPEMVIERFDPVAIAQAEGLAIDHIETALFKAASSGKITAMIFWLANRDPERWKNVASIGRGGEGGGENALEKAIRELQE